VIAAITEAVGLSLALGAFVGGLLLGSSDYAHKLAAKTLPIRDAFVALFFVTVGMLIDPRTWPSNWRLLLVMVGLIVVGKFAVWFGVVRLFGYPAHTALRVGVGLTQIGEFSFILAQVSLHSHLIGADVYNATLAASLITILANATLFRLLKQPPAERSQLKAA
jgi:CPA2 family monovalent cation:H+ antiporter-2